MLHIDLILNIVLAVIVTEKTTILLRYLHQQWDKKVGSTTNVVILFRNQVSLMAFIN